MPTNNNVDEEQRLLVSELSLAQKLSLISGQSLWKLASIPPYETISVQDGPHGVRKPVTELAFHSHPATCFPTACALACSWDTDLLYQVGLTLQQECLYYNVSVLLGPGMNIKRHPAGGRNFEYFSEDPLLSGMLAAAYVRGVQKDNRVGACVKHFCVNNQESHRFVVDAIVDTRTFRELYGRNFEYVIRQDVQPATVMCAYNKINGVYCSEHIELMDEILRKEWGFRGVVMTDWGATNDRVAGIRAGVDLEMPGSYGAHDQSIVEALGTTLPMKNLDDCAGRVLDTIVSYQYAAKVKAEVDWKEHHALAKSVALQCAVLLQNDGILPLQINTSIALIGDFAKANPRYQGMGSSQVSSDTVVTAYDEVFKYTDSVSFAPGYHADLDDDVHVDHESIAEAVRVAKDAEVVVLCIGLPEIMESEGFDREHLCLPAQHNALVEAISEVSKRIVVLLSNGSVVHLPWRSKVNAIMEGFLLGETGGAAMVDLLFGAEVPCGKLSETFPLRMEDAVADKFFPGTRERVEHREGLCVGYRYYDTAKKEVAFPFGHGLSYTTFSYRDIRVEILVDEARSKSVKIECTVENTGSVAAREIVQLYIHSCSNTVFRPDQELRGFTKLHLEPGQSKAAVFELAFQDFAFYDIGVRDWVVEEGEYDIRVGSSSRDIRLQGRVTFATGIPASAMAVASYPAGESPDDVSDDTFLKRFADRAELSEHASTAPEPQSSFNRNSLLKEIASRRLLGKLLLGIVYQAAAKEVKPGKTQKRQRKMVRLNVENLPLRVLVLFSKGGMSFDLLDAMVSGMNFQFFSCLKNVGKSVANCFRSAPR